MKLKEVAPSMVNTLKLLMYSTHRLKSPKNPVPLIVSLTTIPYRLNKVHITIRSILAQDTPPEKVILWLHDDLRDQIPNNLQKLTGDHFSIEFSHLTCSHKKLIHTLKLYPERNIVTCDDDMIYPKHWLNTLFKYHQKNKSSIICNQARVITYNKNGEPLPYKEWKYKADANPSKLLPIGVGGVLYPPKSLDETVTDEELFLKLCPKADDLWFKAMALLKYTNTIKTTEKVQLIPVMLTQKVSLKKLNVNKDFNVEQWTNLRAYFKFDNN